MNPLYHTLERVRDNVTPFDRQGAAVAIVVYHPESMDEPQVQLHEFTREELAANSNRKLTKIVMDVVERRLLQVVSHWRGA